MSALRLIKFHSCPNKHAGMWNCEVYCARLSVHTFFSSFPSPQQCLLVVTTHRRTASHVSVTDSAQCDPLPFPAIVRYHSKL